MFLEVLYNKQLRAQYKKYPAEVKLHADLNQAGLLTGE